jgi:hypothetical protein
MLKCVRNIELDVLEIMLVTILEYELEDVRLDFNQLRTHLVHHKNNW